MIARNIDDARALTRKLKNAPNNFIVRCGPEPALAQPPPINDVANQIQGLTFDRMEKVDQQIGIAPGRAEMNIRNPNSTITLLWNKTARLRFRKPSRLKWNTSKPTITSDFQRMCHCTYPPHPIDDYLKARACDFGMAAL
jgi:hypothetical protein